MKDRREPSTKEILAAIPARCFQRSTARSLSHAAVSVAMTASLGLLARACLPLELWALPLWVLYACAQGTVATGCWVVAHECGHNAFSDSPALTDAVGYVLHSALMVRHRGTGRRTQWIGGRSCLRQVLHLLWYSVHDHFLIIISNPLGLTYLHVHDSSYTVVLE